MCLNFTKEHEFKGEKGILGRKELHLKGTEIDVQKTVCFWGVGKDTLSNEGQGWI